jgi:hypothetical protein
MDYNDIDLRLRRLYSSLDQQYEDNVLQHMQTKVEKSEDGKFTITVDFNAKYDEVETLNKVIGIISGLANLKDHLKTRLRSKGGNTNDIETEIDQDLSLQLIIDLYNQEKHGYPLTKHKRSGKDPRIIDLSKAITSRPGVIATAFIRDPITGACVTDNMAIIISGKVVDMQGNTLYSLSGLINKCIDSWEKIIIKYNLK